MQEHKDTSTFNTLEDVLACSHPSLGHSFTPHHLHYHGELASLLKAQDSASVEWLRPPEQ